VLISIDRGDYWQLAYVIPHQGFDNVKAEGLPAVASAAPALADRVGAITDLPSRTPSRRPMCSGRPSTQAGRRRTISGESSGAESLPPASPWGSR
jgi:hypothetical protein